MSCLFCRIAAKEIPAAIVYEDEKVLAFNDIAPQAPVHILLIPKQHVDSIVDCKEVNSIFAVIKQIAKEKGIEATGYRIVVNHGRDAGQAVPHLHFHLLGGRQLNWPPG
ncbi:MAG: histidine triad nucleotide-binding protein [Candidatus Margulisbacteria bacterium]|nr:histidine triad nucleotide-binding protein [Candidatus Margulisiibacteriota bacterium]